MRMNVELLLMLDMITDNEPIICQFISVPKELEQLNCAALIAGVIHGILDAAHFVFLVSFLACQSHCTFSSYQSFSSKNNDVD